MAIALGTSVSGQASGTTSITLGSVDCTTADCIFLASGMSGGGGYQGVSNVTFNSSATGWTELWDFQFSTNYGVTGHRLLTPTQTTASCVITFAGSCDEIVGGATPMSGVHQTTANRTAGTPATGTSTTPTITGVTADTGDVVMASVYSEATTAPTATGPATGVWGVNHSSATSGAVAQSAGSSPTITVAFSSASELWGIGAAAFIPAGDAAPAYRNIETLAIRPSAFMPGLGR